MSESTIDPAPATRFVPIVFAVLLLAGAALRIGFNNVEEYAPDDEAVYVSTTTFLVQHGWSQYPALVQRYIHDHHAWMYPHPMRWGHFALTTLTAHITGRSDARALADLSTFAGILSIALIFLLGRAILGDRIALVATAIAVTSPLQLAMGRRALQDEVFCASVLLTLWLTALVVRGDARSRRAQTTLVIAAIASTTLVLSIKESSVLYFPPLFAFIALLAPESRIRQWRFLAALAIIPPAAYALVTLALSGGIRPGFELMRIVLTAGSSSSTPFAQNLSSGPWHRPLFDLMILSPLVMLLAVAAAVRSNGNRAIHALSAFAALTLMIFGVLAVKNVRYVIPIDPVARMLAAYAIVTIFPGRRMRVLVLAAILLTEIQLFHQVFIDADVYDPVTEQLLEALHAAPALLN